MKHEMNTRHYGGLRALGLGRGNPSQNKLLSQGLGYNILR